MWGERMLGNDNVHRGNARNRQCKLRESARNRQCKVQECWETTKYAEKWTESSKQGERMPGYRQSTQEKILEVVNVRRKNTRNRQCRV
jgi:hypothetical protein